MATDVYAGALGFLRVSFIGIIFALIYAMFQALKRKEEPSCHAALMLAGADGHPILSSATRKYGTGNSRSP